MVVDVVTVVVKIAVEDNVYEPTAPPTVCTPSGAPGHVITWPAVSCGFD